MCVIRPCKRRNIPTFVFLQISKHNLFRMYGIYCVKIVSNFLQNTRFDSNSYSKIQLKFGTQGPSVWVCVYVHAKEKEKESAIGNSVDYIISVYWYKQSTLSLIALSIEVQKNLFPLNVAWKKTYFRLLLPYKNSVALKNGDENNYLGWCFFFGGGSRCLCVTVVAVVVLLGCCANVKNVGLKNRLSEKWS